jgi:hypothetical protein
MKILRSVTRRGFTVGTAGMFTIVSPNRWFAASQFPRSFERLRGQSAEAAAAAGRAPRGADQWAPSSPHIMILSPDDRHPMRFALIALLATALAFLILWWFFHLALVGRVELLALKL